MRAVVQKVSRADVTVDGKTVGQIHGPGLVALVGVEVGDGEGDAIYIAGKIADVRVFDNPEKPDSSEQSLVEIGGSVLLVSQFTLLGDCRKGRRPSWSQAAPPDAAQALYERVVVLLRERGVTVQTGVFRAHMHLTLTNDGPITLLLDSKKGF